MKRQVAEFLSNHSPEPFVVVSPDSSLQYVLKRMQFANTSAVLVLDQKRLVGIFTESDFARAAVNGLTNFNCSVRDFITTTVYYVDPTYTLENCLQIMLRLRGRHLPVIADGHVLALLSMRQLMAVLVDDKDQQITNLLTYISGSPATVVPLVRNPCLPPLTVSRPQECQAM